MLVTDLGSSTDKSKKASYVLDAYPQDLHLHTHAYMVFDVHSGSSGDSRALQLVPEVAAEDIVHEGGLHQVAGIRLLQFQQTQLNALK